MNKIQLVRQLINHIENHYDQESNEMIGETLLTTLSELFTTREMATMITRHPYAGYFISKDSDDGGLINEVHRKNIEEKEKEIKNLLNIK